MRDAINGHKFVSALGYAATTADRTGSTIDIQGYNKAAVVVQIGTITTADATNYFTFDLYHGDLASGTDATTVPAAERIGAAAVVNSTAHADKTIAFGYLGNKRYLTLMVTETGTASLIAGATADLSDAAQQPASGPDLN